MDLYVTASLFPLIKIVVLESKLSIYLPFLQSPFIPFIALLVDVGPEHHSSVLHDQLKSPNTPSFSQIMCFRSIRLL